MPPKKKKKSIWKERCLPRQPETRQSTYAVVQLVPQGFYCVSTPIVAAVELSLLRHLAQLHCQDYPPGDMQNCISEARN